MYEYSSVTPDPKKENLSQMIYQKIPQTATISQVLTGSVVSDMSYMQQIQQLDITDVSSISTKLSPGVMITSNGEIAGNQADQVRSLFNPSTLKAIASKSNAPFPIESFTSEHLMKDSQLSGASLEELNRLSKFRSDLSQSLLGAQWIYDLEKSSLLNKFGRSVSLASVIEKELRNMTYMQVLQYYTILG